ncbi:MAG: hypothetical protein SVZ03_06815 [Spirochaetota bacterium]|nr:hypothetical protein [Spirochaetota bacterium]
MKLLITLICLFIPLKVDIESAKIDHSLYDSFLQKYVDNGLVDYKAIKDDHGLLTQYLHQLEELNYQNF